MLVNHVPAGVVDPLEYSANEKIVEAVTENVRAGEEYVRTHDASGKVVSLHALELRRRADVLPEENIAVLEHLQSHRKNFNHVLQEFGEVKPCLRHSFPKFKFSKDLLALVT